MGLRYEVDDAGNIWSVATIAADGNVTSGANVTAFLKLIAGTDIEGVNAVLSGDVSAIGGNFSGNVAAVNGVFSADVFGVAATFTGIVTGASAVFAGGVAGADAVYDSVTINDAVINAHDAATKEYVLAATLGLDWQLPIIEFYDPTGGLPASTLNDRYIATATANGWTTNNIYTGNGLTFDETAAADRMSLLNQDDSSFYTYIAASVSWVYIFMAGAHNDLLNKQGGIPLEYYHLTNAEWDTVNGGLKLYDTDASDKLTLVWNEASAAGRALNFLVNGGNRSIDLADDLEVSAGCGVLDQSVASGASPTFGSPIITSFGAGWTNAGNTIADLGTVTTADINGGTADGVTLGAAVPAPGTFSDGAHYGVPLLFTKTIVLPEYVEDEAAIVPLMLVQSSWAPYGIRITRVGMMKNANGAYAIMLEKWTYADPPAAEQDILTGDLATGAGASVIETANTFTGTGTYYDVPVNKIVGLDLPSTTGVKTLTVWFTYELKAS
jgi:hypothetical protein